MCSQLQGWLTHRLHLRQRVEAALFDLCAGDPAAPGFRRAWALPLLILLGLLPLLLLLFRPSLALQPLILLVLLMLMLTLMWRWCKCRARCRATAGRRGSI